MSISCPCAEGQVLEGDHEHQLFLRDGPSSRAREKMLCMLTICVVFAWEAELARFSGLAAALPFVSSNAHPSRNYHGWRRPHNADHQDQIRSHQGSI